MIEKFSKEELEQIKRELGISDNKRKTIVCAEQNRGLKEIWGERKRDCLKVCRGQDYIYKIIDITLSNIYKTNGGNYKFEHILTPSIIPEYVEMYNEILDLIKKHNKPLD